MKVTLVLTSGVIQVGDVQHVDPYAETFSQGGARGAASFITLARHIHTATRLHFTDRDDSEFVDNTIIGELIPKTT